MLHLFDSRRIEKGRVGQRALTVRPFVIKCAGKELNKLSPELPRMLLRYFRDLMGLLSSLHGDIQGSKMMLTLENTYNTPLHLNASRQVSS